MDVRFKKKNKTEKEKKEKRWKKRKKRQKSLENIQTTLKYFSWHLWLQVLCLEFLQSSFNFYSHKPKEIRSINIPILQIRKPGIWRVGKFLTVTQALQGEAGSQAQAVWAGCGLHTWRLSHGVSAKAEG